MDTPGKIVAEVILEILRKAKPTVALQQLWAMQYYQRPESQPLNSCGPHEGFSLNLSGLQLPSRAGLAFGSVNRRVGLSAYQIVARQVFLQELATCSGRFSSILQFFLQLNRIM